MRVFWVLAAATIALAGCGRLFEPASPTRALPVFGRAVGTGVGEPAASSLVVKWSCVTGAEPGACPPQRQSFSDATAAATAPGSPRSLAGTSSGGRVSLTWLSPGSGDTPGSYLIEAGSRPGLRDIADFDTRSAQPSFVAVDVPPGTYYVRVRAKNAAGTSEASNEIALAVTAGGCTEPPDAPTGLTASVVGYVATLTWTAPAGGCAPTSYVILAGSAPGLTDLAASDLGNALTSYAVSGLEPGQYYVRVRGSVAGIAGEASNEVLVSILLAPLASTSFLAFGDSITAGESGLELSSSSDYTLSISRFRPTVLLPIDQRYPTILQQSLASRYRTQTPSVRNAGQGGEAVTDPDTLSRFTALLSSGQYPVVLLMEGTNDLFGPGQSVRRVSETVSALRVMLQAAKARGVRPYLATIPPMNSRGVRGRTYSYELVPAMNDGIRALALSEAVDLVDVNQGFNDNLALLGTDGLHPNADGYAKIAEVFYAAIKATLESR